MTTKTIDPATGEEIIEYPNGSAKRASDGHWIRGPRETAISKDPVGMQKRGQELIKQRSIQQARDALDSGAIRAGRMAADLAGSGYGWFVAIEKAAELYFDAKTARGAEGLLSLIGRATGNLSEKNDGEKLSGEGITATPAAIRELINMLGEEIQIRVEQARAMDGEEA